MSYYLHVETDNLPGAMIPVQEHVDAEAEAYETEIDGIGPVVDEIRTDEDREILEKTNTELGLVSYLFGGLQGLSRGDGESIALLTAGFEHAETQAIDESSGWEGNAGRH